MAAELIPKPFKESAIRTRVFAECVSAQKTSTRDLLLEQDRCRDRSVRRHSDRRHETTTHGWCGHGFATRVDWLASKESSNNLKVSGAMRNRAWAKAQRQLRRMAATSLAVAANKTSDAMLPFCETYGKDTTRSVHHETHDSLIDSLKSHFRKERKENLCLKITVARSEAKKDS
jgi:hypothetical protein